MTGSERSSRSSNLRRLEQLFGGGATSPRPGAGPPAAAGGRQRTPLLEAEPGGPPARKGPRLPSQHRIRLERIRAAHDPQEQAAAIEAFLQHHELPGDLDVLLKVLRHPAEAVVRKGLAELVGMVQRGELRGASVVSEALDALAPRVQEAQTRSFVEGLRALLAKGS